MAGEQPPVQIGSELLRDDPTFANIVLEFVEGLSFRLNTMEKAIREDNFAALRTAAHQLRGSGDGYGYPVLSHQAAELERRAESEAHSACIEALKDLKDLCRRIVVDPA
jgi:HPt (histidine-containing phosphotransfer) domain-containing protein